MTHAEAVQVIREALSKLFYACLDPYEQEARAEMRKSALIALDSLPEPLSEEDVEQIQGRLEEDAQDHDGRHDWLAEEIRGIRQRFLRSVGRET